MSTPPNIATALKSCFIHVRIFHVERQWDAQLDKRGKPVRVFALTSYWVESSFLFRDMEVAIQTALEKFEGELAEHAYRSVQVCEGYAFPKIIKEFSTL